MKKGSIFVLLLALALFIVGCSQSGNQTQSSQTVSNSSSEDQQETVSKSDFPNKPIEVIVPAPPGGSTDILARILSKYVPKYLPNQTNMVIINKPGGNNTIGVSEIFKAEPDGYTIGFVPSSTIATEPHFGNTPYTHDSFQTIARVNAQDGFVYVKSDAPWKTYEEWFQYVKENPGKFKIGAVSGARNSLLRISHDAEIEMNIAPFDGFAESVTSLLGGHIDAAFAIPAAVKAQLDAGEIRPLFGTGGRKVDSTPLISEKGIDFADDKFNGIIAPKGLPEDVQAILVDAFKQALEDQALIEEFKKVNTEPYYGTPEEYQEALTNAFHSDKKTLEIAGLIK